MRKIAIINQKGGVGKTTTAVNLSAALALAGQRVCLADMDPQAHASLHLGVAYEPPAPTMYDLLLREVQWDEVCRLAADNLWLLGSHIDLAAVEVEFAGVTDREGVLRNKLRAAGEAYDYLLIDCPPSLGILTLNALAAVDEVFIPLQPHFLALHGLSKLLETIGLVARRINPQLKLSGIVLCMYESATRLAGEVVHDVQTFLDQARGQPTPWADAHILPTRIRRNIRLAEAPSFGQSIFDYSPDSHGAEDYRQLAADVMSMNALSLAAA